MEQLSPDFFAFFALFAGVVVRVFLPFLQERRQDPGLSWEWKYVWPQLLGVAIAVLTLPLTVPDLGNVADLGAQAAFVIGVGAAEAGDLIIGKPVRALYVKVTPKK